MGSFYLCITVPSYGFYAEHITKACTDKVLPVQFFYGHGILALLPVPVPQHKVQAHQTVHHGSGPPVHFLGTVLPV